MPAFASGASRLLIVGLAPGLRGANRTGRPFTGDFAGDLLYSTLARFGFADPGYDARADDGVELHDCRITNAVRCVPPENRPVAAEIAACRPFLAAEIAGLPDLHIILALGGIAHGAVLAALDQPARGRKFAHGAWHALPAGAGAGGRRLVDSYHCSRLNTNTGRLTEAMFHDVFAAIRENLK